MAHINVLNLAYKQILMHTIVADKAYQMQQLK